MKNKLDWRVQITYTISGSDEESCFNTIILAHTRDFALVAAGLEFNQKIVSDKAVTITKVIATCF